MDFEDLVHLQSKVMREVLGLIELPAPEHERIADVSDGVFLGPPEDFPPSAYEDLDQIALAIGYPNSSPLANRLRLLVLCSKKPAKLTPILSRIVKLAGDNCEIIETGRVRKLASSWQCQQNRPLRVGSAISHCRGLTGSITCFATPANGGRLALLSAGHVLASVGKHAMGDPIIQPGRAYSGHDPRDRVATLTRAIPLLTDANQRNLVDAAYATLLDELAPTRPNTVYDDTGEHIGMLSTSPATVQPGETVLKLGCSGITYGRVKAIRANKVPVWLDARGGMRARFDDLLLIEGARDGAFAKVADSGAIVFKEDLTPVGQILGGSDSGGSNRRGFAYAAPINTVLRLLDLAISP